MRVVQMRFPSGGKGGVLAASDSDDEGPGAGGLAAGPWGGLDGPGTSLWGRASARLSRNWGQLYILPTSQWWVTCESGVTLALCGCAAGVGLPAGCDAHPVLRGMQRREDLSWWASCMHASLLAGWCSQVPAPLLPVCLSGAGVGLGAALPRRLHGRPVQVGRLQRAWHQLAPGGTPPDPTSAPDPTWVWHGSLVCTWKTVLS